MWHFRRNTIKAYYGQQRGYGRAEAMLYSRYPERFNVLGQIEWRGTIPGLAAHGAGRLTQEHFLGRGRPGVADVSSIPALTLTEVPAADAGVDCSRR